MRERESRIIQQVFGHCSLFFDISSLPAYLARTSFFLLKKRSRFFSFRPLLFRSELARCLNRCVVVAGKEGKKRRHRRGVKAVRHLSPHRRQLWKKKLSSGETKIPESWALYLRLLARSASASTPGASVQDCARSIAADTGSDGAFDACAPRRVFISFLWKKKLAVVQRRRGTFFRAAS